MTPTAPIKRLRVGKANNIADAHDRLARYIDRNMQFQDVDWNIEDDFFGEIVAGADLDPVQSEYSNANYFIRTQSVATTVVTGDELALEDDPAAEVRYEVVTASNLAEIAASSHTVPVGTYVRVYRIIIDRAVPVELFWFVSPVAVCPVWGQVYVNGSDELVQHKLACDGTTTEELIIAIEDCP
jgi:hypothetical protein